MRRGGGNLEEGDSAEERIPSEAYALVLVDRSSTLRTVVSISLYVGYIKMKSLFYSFRPNILSL